MFDPSVLTLNSLAKELLDESCSDLTLPPAAVVFAMHQGYQFDCFVGGIADDPAVLHFSEGKKAFDSRGRLSEYLWAAAKCSARFAERRPNPRLTLVRGTRERQGADDGLFRGD